MGDPQLKTGKQDLPAGPFPLPLSALEKYLLWDEQPPFSMSYFVEVNFETRLDLPALREATQQALMLHPLLRARIQAVWTKPQWVLHDDAFPQIRLQHLDPVLKGGWPQGFDLANECGSRFWYVEHDEGSRLLIQIHHACSDGVGMRRFLTDLLNDYARLCGSPAAPAQTKLAGRKELDASLLRERGKFSKFVGPPKRPLNAWQRLKNAHYFHFQPPERLHPAATFTPTDGSDTRDLNEPYEHWFLSEVETRHVMAKSREQGFALNEIALALMFQACCQWNQQHGAAHPNSRIRLVMPYDLRSRIDFRMPAANRLSFSFLGRTHRQCRDLGPLLESIRDEIRCINESHLPMDFLAGLEAVANSPGLMRWILRRSNRMATATLTYGGDLFRGLGGFFPVENQARRVGNARLKTILAAPPVRRNTNLALGLSLNLDRLCVTANWNRQIFSRQTCRDFLSLYQSLWEQWLKT